LSSFFQRLHVLRDRLKRAERDLKRGIAGSKERRCPRDEAGAVPRIEPQPSTAEAQALGV
jgi:hypothetical protein